MSEELVALYQGRRVGLMHYAGDRLRFTYTDVWRDDPEAFPLSLSMPRNQREHRDQVVRPFISGLLPDDNEVLRRWGQKFHVSPRNPFRLLAHIGEECAGAIQFVTPERADAWLERDAPEDIDWLGEAEFVKRIANLVNDSSQARLLGDVGQFSLAGAQAKTALYRDAKLPRWGIPKGATPTTHILKPNRGNFVAFELNEHFCLRLASELGLITAKSRTETIGDVRVIIIERYDRIRLEGKLIRIHQEDTCQALAKMPDRKYQNEAGPSAKELFALIRNHSTKPQDDVLRFLDALIFNYLIAGSDAHAKNYSLLFGGGGQIRLAPLYDLISTLPYPREIPPRQIKLAMKIGGEYKHYNIGAKNWEKAAREWGLDRDQVLDRLVALAQKLPETAAIIARKISEPDAPSHDILDRITVGISKNADAAIRSVNRHRSLSS